MTVKNIYIYLLLFFMTVLPVTDCLGQGIQSLGNYGKEGGFYIDYTQFRTEREGFNRLEVYYKIFNQSVQFIKKGNTYQARYELNLTVFDRDGRQITATSRERTITVADYQSISNADDFRVSMFDFILPQGKYEIELILLDKNSGNRIKRSIKAELDRYGKREPMLSGIEFAQFVDSSVVDSVFGKGNITVIPSVTRVYAGDSTAYLKYYYEIYRGKEDRREIIIETRLLDDKLEIVYRDSVNDAFPEGEGIIRRAREISLWGLKSGDYTLQIILRGWRQRAVAQKKELFIIYWTPEAMVLHDYEKAVKQLKFIASKDESDKLKSAATPEKRLDYWNEFWLARDPSPGTEENEAKRNYYRRIEYANRNFSILRKEGWRTDRGMIVIQYGLPDHIEDYPFELDSKAYVIWYYYHLKDPREFLFVDEWGDGDYQLQYPYDGKM